MKWKVTYSQSLIKAFLLDIQVQIRKTSLSAY
jgi:hypothetical protein